MLDLANMPTGAVVRLTKATPKREGSGISWDVDLSMEVASEVDAQAVDAYLPGAASAFAAREGSRGSASTSGSFDMLRVDMLKPDGESLATCHAEVRKCSIKVTASQGVLTVSLRLHGLVQEAAMQVVYQLDEQVQVQLRPHATQLSLPMGVEPDKPSAPALDFTKDDVRGKLVVCEVGDDVVAGIVHDVVDKTTLEISTLNEEDPVVISVPDKPSSVLAVSAPKGEYMHSMLREYVERCDAAKATPCWTDIISAIGEMYAEGSASEPKDGSWEVNRIVLDRAYQAATRR